MSTYDRPYYAPRSKIASTAFTKSTDLPKERKITFSSEWHFYPEGVKAVRDRFNHSMTQQNLVAKCEWNDETNSFRLRCQAGDTTSVATSFRDVICGTIKQEIKKGYKGNLPSRFQDDDSDENEPESIAAAANEGKKKAPPDEVEELALDVTESLNSRFIRRLAQWEEEIRLKADIICAQAMERESQNQINSKDEYPAPVKFYKFRIKWSCADDLLRLDQTASDEHLQELRRLAGCELIKDLNKGIVYIGSEKEENTHLATFKLDNLRKTYRPNAPYVGHFFYSEGHQDVRFVVKPVLTVKKFYFETTLLDGLHILRNGGRACKAGELPPAWQKLSSAVTIRCALYERKTGRYEPIKKLDISPIVSDPDAGPALKEWAHFRYCSRGESSDNPLRHFSNSVADVNNTATPVPAHPPNGSSNPAINPLPSRHANEKLRKILQIEQWAEDVGGDIGEAHTFVNPDEIVDSAGTDALWEVVPTEKPAWDTYKEYDPRQIRRTRKENPSQVISTSLNGKVSAMKRVTAAGSYQSGQKTSPTKRLHSENDQTRAHRTNVHDVNSSEHRSVSQAIAVPMTATRAPEEPIMPQAIPAAGVTPQELAGPATPALFDITNASLVDTRTPPPAQKPSRTVNIEFSEDFGGIVDFFDSLAPRNLLDEDISVVAYQTLQPSNTRPSIAETSLTPIQPLSLTSGSGEELISFTPPIEPEKAAAISEVLISLDSLSKPPTALSDASSQSPGANKPTEPEKMQEVDEVATRTFHNTMNQRAGRGKNSPKKTKKLNQQKRAGRLPLPSPPPTKVPKIVEEDFEDPVQDFVEDIEESFVNMMSTIRPFRGQITLQVELGRILIGDISDRVVFHNFGDKISNHSEMQKLIVPTVEGGGPFCSFTNVLSPLVTDMQYLVTIKDRNGKKLWQPVANWSVVYEFHFRELRALDSPFFLVEVDAETFQTRVKIRRELGDIYIHGTMRHWDYRINGVGHGGNTALQRKYFPVGAAIEKTLYIPPDLSTPTLLWELDSTMSEQFQLEELHVKRLCRHESASGKSILNITEVQSLDIDGRPVPDTSITVFKATPAVGDGPPRQKLRKWWEAAIQSVDANEVFRENKSLELGDLPKWTAETMAKANIASALYLPAFQMLKGMDGVGQLNRNHIDARSATETSKFTTNKEPVRRDQPGFW